MRRGLLATRDELRQLGRLVGRKAFAGMYQALQKRCALILEAAPMTETRWRTLWTQGHWGSALQAARAVQGRVLDLLISHHIDANRAYRDRAIEELNILAGWSTWVDPCHNHTPADMCTAEAAVAVAVGLDWLWEDLPEADRDRLLDALRDKGIDAYLRGVEQGAFWANVYNCWNAVVNGGCGLAALALADEDESAREAYGLARKNLEQFFAALGREGGWDEGIGYWGYAMRYVLLLAEAARRVEDDETLLHRRGMDSTGLFGIYFTPNGQSASFGDAASGVPLHGTFYLLSRHFDRREVTWWLDTYAFHRDVGTTGWSTAGLAMLFRPPAARTPKKPDLKPVKVFQQIGWAAMADQWPKPRFYVAAKTGDLGASHSQHDMNTIQLQVDGEMLLTDLGGGPNSREYFSEARGEFYEAQAQAHNTVIVAERDHQIDAQGRMLDSRSGRGHRYVACDAGSACGENVRFIRHVTMVLDEAAQTGVMLVVLDDLTNGVPEKVEWFWHTHGRLHLDAGKHTGTLTGERAGLQFALASTARLEVTAGSYPIDRRQRDNILRATAGIVGRALTVSVFSRRPIDGDVGLVEEADGVRVTAGQVELCFVQPGRDLRLRRVTAS
ncbi:MAG TPA: heparinase II/III family protein [Phycisphaerae bacterium]|nr:heparinase II/III family protein [Phycisphaerae bacterium]